MTNAKRLTKKLLSVVLCLAMVLPMLLAAGVSPWLAIFDDIVPDAAAAASDIKIIVPETIYLTPSTGSSTTGQYYVNNNADGSVKAATTSPDTTASISIKYPGAKLTSVSAKTSTNVTLPASITGLVGTTFGSSATTVTGAITLGAGVSAGNTALIEWTFVFDVNGKTQTHYAYTVAYAPWYQPVGAAARAVGAWHNVYTSSILWVQGVHGYTAGSAPNGYYVQTSNFLPMLGNLKSPANNDPTTNWIQEGSNGLSPTISYQSISESGTNYHARANTISPTALLSVDTSRYSNFNQIPNFRVSFMITDKENATTNGDNHNRWYVADYGWRNGSSYYNGTDRGSSQYTGDWNDSGTILWSGNSDTSCGIKVNQQVWNKAISGVGALNYRIKGAAEGMVGKTITATSWNNDFVNIEVTGLNKSGLRSAVQFGATIAKENYTADTWNTFYAALKADALKLGNPAATNAEYDSEYAAMGLATYLYLDAATNGGVCNVAYDAIVVGIDNSGLYDVYTKYKATREGYAFKGWNTDPNATTGSQNLTVTYNTKVYAIFEKAVKVQFTYLTTAGSATSSIENIFFYNNDTTKSVTVPMLEDFKTVTKKGEFTLLGFRADDQPAAPTISLGSTLTYDAATVLATNRYYAVYSRDDLTVTFDNSHEDASGAPAAMTASQYISAANKRESKDFAIPATIPTREGYEFLGWADKKGADAVVQPGGTYTTNVDATLYAVWAPTSYKVTYDTNGGNEMTALQYDAENKKAKLGTPSRVGYDFVAWEVVETVGTWVAGDKFEAGTKLLGNSGNVTMKALWAAKTDIRYSVYQMLQNADATGYDQYKSKIVRGTADAEIDITALVEADIYGYAYNRAEANGEAVPAKTTVLPDGSRVIMLYYDRVDYAVTLETSDGVTAVTGAGDYRYESVATVKASCAPGYAFVAWVDAGGNVVSTDAEYSFAVTADVALKATAQHESYTITYEDGTVLEYNYGDDFTFKTAEKAGYTFDGWKIEVVGTRENNWLENCTDGEINTTDAIITNTMYGDIALTAKWIANTYTITYVNDDDSVISTGTYTAEDTLTLQTASKEGAVFVGWDVSSPDGNWADTYAGEQEVSGMYGDVTLKAMYRDSYFTLVFDADGGNKVETMIYAVSGNVARPIGATAVLPTATRPGYEFDGWTCVASSAGADDPAANDWVVDQKYAAGDSLVGMSGNAEFVANWNAKAFTLTVNKPATVTYVGDESIETGKNYTANISVDPGYELGSKVTVLIDGEPAYRANYVYATNADRSTATLTVYGSAIVGNVEITVTATPIVYTISYASVYPNHGFATTYTIESEDITIGEPEINGHVFAGWTGTGLDSAAKTIVIPKGSMGDRTYTATWNREYKVVFVNTGDSVIDSFTFMEGEEITIPEPTKEYSKFVHWQAEGWGVETLDPGTYTAKNNDLRLTAVFDDSTTYTVETYYMNTNGEYVMTDSVDVPGKFPGETATITAEAVEGFTLDAENSVLEGEVVVEGGLTLKKYYARNQYTITVEKDANIASVSGEGTYYYEEKVTLIAAANGGYSIVGWTNGENTVAGDTIEVEIGLADVNLSVTSKANEYTITFKADGAEDEVITYTAESTVNFKTLAGKDGYDLFWVLDADEGNWTAGNYEPGEYTGKYGNIIVSAELIARDDTVYTVKIYTQNIENDEYTLIDTQSKTGTTATLVEGPEEIEGFEFVPSDEVNKTIAGDGSTVVEYKYNRKVYTVTFMVLDKKYVEASYKFGAAIAEPAKPVANGYIFRNWGVDADNEALEIADVMGAENLVYTATMEARPYTLTYKNVEGEGFAPVKYYIYDELTLPEISKVGYNVYWTMKEAVDGWNAGTFASGAKLEADKYYGDVTLYATYVPNQNTKYIENSYFENVDGTFGEPTVKELVGDTDAVVEAPVDVENYVTPEASVLTIAGDGTTVVDYYYYLAKYTVSYKVFDEVTTVDYKVGQTIEKPADPEVTGYVFTGWTPAIDTVMPNADLSYKAEFEAIPYTITFDANGGSTVESVTYDIEDTLTLPESELADNYFVGWEVVSAEGNWAVGDVIKSEISAMYGNATLKAVWSATQSTYTVETYFMDENGIYGEASVSEPITGYVGETVKYTAVETAGYSLDTANSVVEAVIANDGSTVLKAYYARNKYKVTVKIEGNGAQVVSGEGEYYFGATVNAEISIDEHYELASWTGVEADGTTVSFTMPMEDVEIKAVVTPVVYTFTVDMKDGSEAQVIEYTIEDTVKIPENAERDAYTFNGWNLNSVVGNWTQADIVSATELDGKYGNVTISATWTAKTYTFAYDVNGGTMPGSYYFNEDTYTAETPIILPQPTKAGYIFAGWTVAAEGDNNWQDAYTRSELEIGKGMYGNVVLTAAWTAVEVNVYVEHYRQDTWSDEYLLIAKQNISYAADSTIDISAEVADKNSNIIKHAEGQFHFEKALVDGVEATTAVVAADGSTTIQIYYLLDSHKVTIEYVTPDGVEAPATFEDSYRFGQTYNIKSPEVIGYNPSTVTVSGTMGTDDVKATITYSIASYKLTVNYIYANRKAAAESVTQTLPYGTAYSIASPDLVDKYGNPVYGYTPSQAVVEGIMGNENIEIDVVYGIDTHTLTIHYEYADGTKAADDYVANLEYGYAYNVKSAVVDGYTASSPYVSGTITADTELTVTYAVNTYTVIFRDYDGREIDVQYVVYGGAATAPEAPVRAADDKYSYEFKGWSADFSNVSGDMIIVAEYVSTNLSTGETEGNEPVDDSFFGRLKAFFQRLIKFFTTLFIIT